jgi:DNA-binding XRE family transcriptional regulator
MGFPRWFLSITPARLFPMPHARQIQPKSGPEKAFGFVLREIRKAAGLSQLDAYIKFGIDRTQLSAIERGVQSPTLRTIVRLSQAFRVTPSEMMRRMERSRFYSRHGD